MPAAVASQWRDRQRRVFQSVFQTDVTQPTPHSTPSSLSAGPGHPFGGPAGSLLSQSLQQQQLHQEQTYHHHGHGHPPGEHPFSQRTTPGPHLQTPAQPLFPSLAPPSAVPDDQVAYDRAWHVVTAHIALPSSATADDSFGTLAAGSQQRSSSGRRDAAASEKDFHDAFALLVNPASLLPRATRTDDILSWHVRQVRAHYTQHVIPLLAGCVGDGPEDGEEPGGGRWPAGKKGNYYERHMVIVMSSIRTLEAALRLYFYGLNQLLSGFASLADVSPEVAQDAELLNTRFRRDLHALVSNSASEGLMRSVKAVLVRLAGTILGVPSHEESGVSRGQARPAVPGPDDLKVQAARERLMELVRQLHNVGLAGERFQILFAHVMDAMMSAFVTGAYAGLWSAPETGSFGAAMDSVSQGTSLSVASPCIMSLNDWVENHFARLSFEVLACISPNPQGHLPVSLADLKTYQSLALGRLAALRIQELFDIVLAWPASRPALDDLRATITTPARRKQLTDSFSRALQKRLLHPGCSTLEILQTYISIIRTLHALDPSRVILSNVEQGLHMYLCQREDSIRAVVSGLLASPEEMRAARKVMEVWKHQREKSRQDETNQTKKRGKGLDAFTSTNQDIAPETADHPTIPSKQPHPHRRPTKLVELALLLNDPSQQRRQSRHTPSSTTPTATDADTSLDWNDPTWLPDPIDAGAGYRHRAAHNSEDVIGTLIAALGSGDTFIKEFAAVVADRLLAGDPAAARFDQELRVLDLLKRRFGEASLQGVDVMIRDVGDSRRVDGGIRRQQAQGGGGGVDEGMEYRARILSRLFWPALEREHFLLPAVVVEQQKRYEAGYERLKSRRKLAWLNQMGMARVELELRDRTVTVDCSTVEATVVYAFQREGDGGGDGDGDAPVERSVEELYEKLQMDEDLITAALQFWVGKGVLRRSGSSPSSYVVAETINEPTSATAATDQPMDEEPEPAAAAAAAGKQAMSPKERERRDMYWRYIQGMLTNASASMPLAQMAMMMKMLIADGFAWGNEELQDFLGEKVAAGEMEVVGGKYRLVKK